MARLCWLRSLKLLEALEMEILLVWQLEDPVASGARKVAIGNAGPLHLKDTQVCLAPVGWR